MNNYRHYVDVIEPTSVLGDRGEVQGERTLKSNVPCSIKFLSGREAEVARMRLPQASVQISMNGPIKGLSAMCVLAEHPIVDGKPKARWHVGWVDDPSRVGRELHCTCEGEV